MFLEKLVELLTQVWQFFIPFRILDDYEKGVVLRLGRFNREIGPGWNWIWFFGVEKVLKDNVVARTIDLPAQSVTTQDGVEVLISTVVTAKIRNIKKALLEVEAVDSVIKDSCVGSIGTIVAKCTWEELRQDDFPDRLRKACHERATTWGWDIMAVQAGDLTRSPTLRIAGVTFPPQEKEES